MAKNLPNITLEVTIMGIELITEPLQYSFILRALVICVLVGVMCPFLGAFVINREMGFMGDALAHSVLPGMVVAYSVGFSPIIGATPNAIIVALAIGFIVKKTKLSNDTSIGIIFSTLFSIGLITISFLGGTTINVEDILLGEVLSTTTTDVFVTTLLTIFLLIVMIILYKPMIFTGFDFEGAKVAGIPSEKLDYLLLVLLSIVIVITLQVIGVILVIGMLITPAAASSMIAKRFPQIIIIGIAFGVFSSVLGLYLSYYFNLPSGPSIALVSSSIFGLSLIKKWITR
ncbi:MAG: manganese ABC transporter permease [Chloroflexi bacterium]|nr:manganese ABC transporter permease [Chloroflexota bacterium]